jgi:hypothetical protein
MHLCYLYQMERNRGYDPIRSGYLESGQLVPEATWNYAEWLEELINTPDMASEWGCITATGAFVHNFMRPENRVTPAQVDRIIGRGPNDPGDDNLVDVWHLDNGLNIDAYLSRSVVEDFLPYLQGTMDFDEFFARFERDRGPVHSAADRKLFRDFNENVRKPAYAALETKLQPYRENGQYTEINQEPSPELLIQLVNQGKLVYVDQYTSDVAVHALVVFRPSMDHPAFYFYPDLSTQNGGQGSFISMVTTDTLDSLMYDNTFRAVSR